MYDLRYSKYGSSITQNFLLTYILMNAPYSYTSLSSKFLQIKADWYKNEPPIPKNCFERSIDMAMTYKQKLIGEINSLPEDLMPRFYRIVRTLRSELTNKTAVKTKRGSLRGIWGNLEIDETHISAARKSLFSYEYKEKEY